MIRLAAKMFTLSLVAACSATIGQDPPGGGNGGGGGGAGGGGGGTDASCPDVHFMATKTTPYVQLLIDRSGSMDTNLSGTNTSRYNAMHDALVGTTGVVEQLQGQVYFGASLFSDDSPCPNLYSMPRALNNYASIKTLIEGQAPGGATPTAKSIDKVVADFAANPVPTGATPIIVLATDGLPNDCNSNNDTSAQTVVAAKAAYAAGIRLYIIGIAGIADNFLQDMANAGTGVQQGQPNAAYYTSNSASQMTTAFQQIIGGVLSCDLQLSGTVDTSQAASGTVTLNGMTLQYGTDWTLANGNTLELLGNACNTLKNSTNPTVDASFSCGAVIQ
jgi:hypothetical protein